VLERVAASALHVTISRDSMPPASVILIGRRIMDPGAIPPAASIPVDDGNGPWRT